MKHEVQTAWKGELQFNAGIDGFQIAMDGEGNGIKPKKLMLAALGGCTAMDVIAILKKMKVQPIGFTVKAEGDITEEHPKHYQSMRLIYEFAGDDLPIDKIKKAIELSQEKYCGVSHMYKQILDIAYEIRINEKQESN